jgi:hypothetical protein
MRDRLRSARVLAIVVNIGTLGVAIGLPPGSAARAVYLDLTFVFLGAFAAFGLALRWLAESPAPIPQPKERP